MINSWFDLAWFDHGWIAVRIDFDLKMIFDLKGTSNTSPVFLDLKQ